MRIKKMVIARRASQMIFLLFFIYVLWSTTYPLTGFFSPELLFKTDPLVMFMTSISERVILPGISLAIAMIILTVVIGRFFCGWVCPLGSVIDMVGALRKKRGPVDDRKNFFLRRAKFYILAALFVSALFGRQVAWIFDPIVIMGRFVSLNLIPSVTSAINSVFIVLIKYAGAPGAVKDFYHAIKPLFLGVKVYFFSNSSAIFVFFLAIIISALALKRFWCRALCPLGATYALFGGVSPLVRIVKECRRCGMCKSDCRMGAIRDDLSYVHGECVLCMDCLYDCPDNATRFQFAVPGGNIARTIAKGDSATKTVSRRNFLLIFFGGLSLFGGGVARASGSVSRALIRPPAALKEEEFVNRCVRCGNCMKVCPTNALHPTMMQAGLGGLWTPQVTPEIGYCEYQCTLCGSTCPTGALPKLSAEEKARIKLGVAEVDRSICLPWATGQECLVCQEHCPISEKAIKLDNYAGGSARPYVDEYLCVGCGICQNKCPVRPVRAIRVSSKSADRT